MEETPFLIPLLHSSVKLLLLSIFNTLVIIPPRSEPLAIPFLLQYRKRSYLLAFNFEVRIHIQLQRQNIVEMLANQRKVKIHLMAGRQFGRGLEAFRGVYEIIRPRELRPLSGPSRDCNPAPISMRPEQPHQTYFALSF